MSTPTIQPFHLAFPVADIEETTHFYRDVLGCETGRSSDTWIDFNFWGHQVVANMSLKPLKMRSRFLRSSLEL